MEEEIDVKEYLGLLRRRWRIVLVLFLVTVAAATAVTLLQPPAYEAQVRLVERSYTLLLTDRLQSLDERAGQPSKMYPLYVKSGAVEGRVIERLESILSPVEKVPGVLRRRVRLVTRDDPAIFDIVVTASSPDKAVQIANAWAEEYVAWIKESSQGLGAEVELTSQQLSDAEQRLAAAEEALDHFKRETGIAVVGGEYDSDPYPRFGARGKELEQKVLLLASHRVAQDNLSLLIQSAEEIKRTGGKISDLPLELLSVEAIANRGHLSIEQIAEQGEDIDAVIALLKAEEEIISNVTEALSGEVTDLQAELISLDGQLTLLERDEEDALEIYRAVQNKLEELRIRQATVGILGEATTSQRPTGLGRTQTIGIGILFGLFIGVGGAFLLDYLPGPEAKKRGG